MATQGIVTIVHDGEVVMKFIVGCDGMNAGKLARALKKKGIVPKLAEAYNLARELDFGSPTSLVIMGEKRSKFDGCIGRLPRLYRQTFSQPRFNPRWKYGTASHVKVVEL